VLEPDSPWRRLVSVRSGVKAGAFAVAGSLALGGVAAAATGVVPTGPLQGVAHFFGVSDSQSAEPQSDEPSDSASGSDSTEPSESESASSTPTQDSAVALATATSSFSPTSGPNPLGPAAWGLCHAFGNKTWGNGAFATSTESPNPDGRKPDNPSVAYQNLKDAVAAFGPTVNDPTLTVDGFCQVVLQNHGMPSAWPSASDSSSSQAPSGVSSTAPSYTSRGNGHGHGHSGEHGKAKGLNRG
jgi:hypothetical protein